MPVGQMTESLLCLPKVHLTKCLSAKVLFDQNTPDRSNGQTHSKIWQKIFCFKYYFEKKYFFGNNLIKISFHPCSNQFLTDFVLHSKEGKGGQNKSNNKSQLVFLVDIQKTSLHHFYVGDAVRCTLSQDFMLLFEFWSNFELKMTIRRFLNIRTDFFWNNTKINNKWMFSTNKNNWKIL